VRCGRTALAAALRPGAEEFPRDALGPYVEGLAWLSHFGRARGI